MNRYEEKQEARRQRLLDRAAKHKAVSEASFKRVESITSMIPLGQPILVGHHSERRARKDQERIHNGMRKGIDEENYAKDLQRRAAGVGTGGISSDDPEAVVKLKDELTKLEKLQERMKAANLIIRKSPKNEWTLDKQTALEGLGIHTAQAKNLFEKDFAGRIGFADYKLTNNGANIRRIKGRIEELSKQATRQDKETEYPEISLTVRENTEINRVQLIFPSKPDEATRQVCKSNGFHWSPYENAWQRHLNNSGIWAAKEVIKKLSEKGKVQS